jgi:hypothetical protein
MTVRINVGRLGAAIEAGKRASESIDYGPTNQLATVHYNQNRFIADWHNVDTDADLFIWNIDTWGSTTKKVTK